MFDRVEMLFIAVSFVLFASASLQVRLFSGLCVATTFAITLCIALAFISGLNLYTIGVSTAAAGLPCFLLMLPDIRARLRDDVTAAIKHARQSRCAFLLHCCCYSMVIAGLFAVFSAALIENEEGIYTAILNNIGDLPFHLSVISSLSWGGNLPPKHPLYAGVSFAYPFLTDFLSAAFVVAGAGLHLAMLTPNVLFAMSMFVLLKSWTKK
jgi:hypothetical protein